MRFVKPIDEELILKMAATHDLIVTVEENMVQGGAGEAVNQVLAENGVVQAIVNYGLPDRFIQHVDDSCTKFITKKGKGYAPAEAENL